MLSTVSAPEASQIFPALERAGVLSFPRQEEGTFLHLCLPGGIKTTFKFWRSPTAWPHPVSLPCCQRSCFSEATSCQIIKAGGSKGKEAGVSGREWSWLTGRRQAFARISWGQSTSAEQPWLFLVPALGDGATTFCLSESERKLVWEVISYMVKLDRIEQKVECKCPACWEHKRKATSGHWWGARMEEGHCSSSDGLLFRWRIEVPKAPAN